MFTVLRFYFSLMFVFMHEGMCKISVSSMQLLRNKTIAQQLIPFCKLCVVAYEMKYENDKKNPE